MSFPTGGGGTANNGLAEERKRAGLPYKPASFDPARGEKPAVYAGDELGSEAVFQRLPIVGGPEAMVYATASSKDEARITALVLILSSKPTAPPTLRASPGRTSQPGCEGQSVDIYASRMSPVELRRLLGEPACWRASGCRATAERPRGRVLFVRPLGGRFEHRWIDYDLLATTRRPSD